MRQIVFSGFYMHHLTLFSKDPMKKILLVSPFYSEGNGGWSKRSRSHKVAQLANGRVGIPVQLCTPHHHSSPGALPIPSGTGRPLRKPPWKSERFGTSTRRNASWPFKYNTCFNYDPLKRWHLKSRKKVQVSGLQYLQKEANRDKRKTHSCQSNSTLARILI